MSAIAGILTFAGERVDALTFHPALDRLAHYGADGQRVWQGENTILAHVTRNIELEDSTDTQPFSSGDLVITADARIDNRDELLDRLGLRDRDARQISSAGLLLRAYAQWGESCGDYLVGEYAFAIWDSASRRLFCQRDIVGARPFYYYVDQHRFAFASDLNALLALPFVSDALDEKQIARYVIASTHFTQVSPAETFYRDVYQLAFGFQLTATPTGRDSVQTTRYWHPENVPDIRFAKFENYAEEAYARMHTATAACLRTKHTVGAHFSGGIDSSSIAVIAQRLLKAQGRELHAFSWSPAPQGESDFMMDKSEYPRMEAIRQREALSVHYVSISPSDYQAWRLRDLSKYPVDTLLHESQIQKLAASLGVRRILTGYGGDEGISYFGEGFNAEDFARGRWGMLARRLRLRHAISRAVRGRRFNELATAIRTLWRTAILPMLSDSVYARLYAQELFAGKRFLQPSFAARFAADHLTATTTPIQRPLRSVRETQIRMYYHGHFSARMADWAAAGAEYDLDYAYPLTNRRVLEFVYSTPAELHSSWYQTDVRGAEINRYLFRRAIEPIMPPGMVWDQHFKTAPGMNRQFAGFTAGADTTSDPLLQPNPWVDSEYVRSVAIDRSMSRQSIALNMALSRAWCALILWEHHKPHN